MSSPAIFVDAFPYWGESVAVSSAEETSTRDASFREIPNLVPTTPRIIGSPVWITSIRRPEQMPIRFRRTTSGPSPVRDSHTTWPDRNVDNGADMILSSGVGLAETGTGRASVDAVFSPGDIRRYLQSSRATMERREWAGGDGVEPVRSDVLKSRDESPSDRARKDLRDEIS